MSPGGGNQPCDSNQPLAQGGPARLPKDRGGRERPFSDAPSQSGCIMVPLVREGLWEALLPVGLSVFKDVQSTRVRHTFLFPIHQSAAQPPAGKGEGCRGRGPRRRRPWFPASSLRTPSAHTSTAPSFSSFLPFIPSDAVCGGETCPRSSGLLGAETPLNPSSPPPWPPLPESSELCLMTVTIKDFLLRRVKEHSLMGPGPKANPYPFPRLQEKRKKKKNHPSRCGREFHCLHLQTLRGPCPQTHSERCQHS